MLYSPWFEYDASVSDVVRGLIVMHLQCYVVRGLIMMHLYVV